MTAVATTTQPAPPVVLKTVDPYSYVHTGALSQSAGYVLFSVAGVLAAVGLLLLIAASRAGRSRAPRKPLRL